MEEIHRVALVGIGCRYCQIQNLREFQKTLENEICGNVSLEKRFREFQERFHPDSEAEGKLYAEKAFFLSEDPQKFDADFFHISYKEAECMDYQQRMLLQVTQEALEDGGILIRGTESSVFVGAFMQDFLTTTMQKMNYDNLNGFHATGSSIGMLANKLSYFYDLHGPSMGIDTACSSSLTALHLAAESIGRGTCAMSICAGVNMITELGNFITLSKGGFLSRESLCHAFGEQADGYARGEGVGVVVLKNLEQAVRDRDRIYCEIVSSAVNHDGRKKGISFPNRDAQIGLLRKIYGGDNLSTDAIGYLEAHGTGTQAGDCAEVSALQEAFHDRKAPLIIGSVKTNIGHTEAAAGMASVIKGILTLQNRVIYKTLHCEKKNPDILWKDSIVQPAEHVLPLKAAQDGRYYVGINGFGFGGSNAHVVLGSIPQYQDCADGERNVALAETREADRPVSNCSFCLSANSRQSLYALARDYMNQIQAGTLRNAPLEKICACVSCRREQDYPFRLAMTVSSRLDFARKLSGFLNDSFHSDVFYKHQAKKRKKIAAIFSGMGVQQEGMGRELYREFKVFKTTFRKCSDAFIKAGGVDLIPVIEARGIYEGFWDIGFLQPYNLAYQISLYELIRSFGIRIDGCVGHSAGELGSFYCSGFLSLEESFQIAFHRGRVQQKQQGKGRMLAIGITREEAEGICVEYPNLLSVGVENGKEDIVLSGDSKCLEEIRTACKEGVFCKFLKGDVAYHSCQMDAVKADFLGSIVFGRPAVGQLELYSTVYAERIDSKPECYDSLYWWKNIRNTVEFYRTVQEMQRDGYDGFIEIGATPALFRYIAEVYSERDYSYVAFQKKNTPESDAFFRGVDQTYVNHMPVDFEYYYGIQPMLELPKYKWDWRILPNRSVRDNYILDQEINGWLGDKMNFPQDMWEKRMNQVSQPWITGHKVEQDCYVPATAYISMLYDTGEPVLNNIDILCPVVVEQSKDVILNLAKYPDGATASTALADRKHWRTCMKVVFGKEKPFNMDRNIPHVWNKREMNVLGKSAVYHILDEKALHYSGNFQCIKTAYIGKDDVFACLEEMKEGIFEKENMAEVLDSMLQAAALAGSRDIAFDWKWAYLPDKIEKTVIFSNQYKKLCVYAKIREKREDGLLADTFLLDENDIVLAAFYGAGFTIKDKPDAANIPSYQCAWERIGAFDGASRNAGDDLGQDAGRHPEIYVTQGNLYRDTRQLLRIIQDLGEQGELAVITENGVKVLEGDDLGTLDQAGIRSLCRCMAQEYPQISLVMVETDRVEDARQLLRERHLWEQEAELAVRKNVIYGMRLKQTEEQREFHMEPEDTAAITGAAGGLAYPYAMALAAAGAKNIVLLSRQDKEKTEVLSEVLTYYGVNVRHCKVDITVPDETSACIKSLYRETKGELYIHHLAGFSRDGRCEDITEELLERHIRPKVRGAENLLEALGESKKNLFLIGSLIAALGNHGQGAYGAANGILQEISEREGCRYMGFGAMNTGMLMDGPDIVKNFEAQGICVMDAGKAVRQALSMDADTGYVAQLNWNRVLEQRSALADKRFQYVCNSPKERSFLDIWKMQDRQGQQEQMREFLIGVYAQILDIDRGLVSADRPLETMGIHSLGATLASNYIRQTLGIKLTSGQVSGNATIQDLAGEIQQELLRIH